MRLAFLFCSCSVFMEIQSSHLLCTQEESVCIKEQNLYLLFVTCAFKSCSAMSLKKHKHVKRRDQGTPVPMDMGGTKSEAVVKKSGVNNSPTFCSFQQITKVTQMSVTTSNSVPGTVLVQDKHLARAKPSLHNENTDGDPITAYQLPKTAHCHECVMR